MNLATIDNGCRVIESSGNMGTGKHPTKLKTNYNSSNSLWINGECPQSITLELKGKPYLRSDAIVNTVGIEITEVSSTNPKVIQISCSNDNINFLSIGAFCCKNHPSWQFVTFQDIPRWRMRYVKITVVENYGSDCTIFPQIYIGMGQPGQVEEQPVQQYKRKIKVEKTQTEENLKGRIEALEEENKILKDKVKQQAMLLEQLQYTVGVLVKNLDLVKTLVQQPNNFHQPSAALTFCSIRDSPYKFEIFEQDLVTEPKIYRRTLQDYKRKFLYGPKQSQPNFSDSYYSIQDQNNKNQTNKLAKEDMGILLSKLQQKLTIRDKLQKKLNNSGRRYSFGSHKRTY